MLQLNYFNGTITPPGGWSILSAPSCSDNTPTQWLQTSWGGLNQNPHRIQCFYQVKGYVHNSGCGGWSIVRNATSPDPWLMPNRPPIWIDNDSHKDYPQNPWDFCQVPNGTLTSCYFPV